MAASLGSLVVSLGLDAAQFTAGLNKAEFEAQRATKRLKQDIDAIGTAFGVATVAVGAFALKIGSDFISAAANLDDMAEKTGASVEELSKLSQQAHISGVSLDTVEQALVQLSKHLQGAGEDSKNTERALAALGLKASELKNLDTAEALQRVAVALNQFADGSGKSALATDLLGKSGAQALPFLKDMANDAALAANVTAKQAAEAEELGKAWRRLTLDAKNVGQAMALDIVPYLRDLIEQFRVGKEVAGGFWDAIRLFGLSTITKSNAADKIGEITTEIGKLEEKLASPRFKSPQWQQSISKQITDLNKQLEFSKLLMRQAEDARLAGQSGNEAPTRPQRQLNYKALTPPDNSAANKAEQAAERYRNMLVSLESQLRSVTGAETELQKIREKIAADKDFALIPQKERERLLAALETTAKQIDQAREQKQIQEENKKLLEQGDKGWIAYAESVFAAAHAEDELNASLVKSPKQLQDIANSIKLTLDPLHEFEGQWNDINDLVAQDFLTEAEARLAKLPSSIRDLVQPIENVFQQIQRLWEANRLTDEQMEAAFARAVDQLDRAEDSAKDFAHAIGTAFEDAIVNAKSFKDVLAGLAQDIARIFIRQTVTKPLEAAIGGLISGGFGWGAGTQASAPVSDAIFLPPGRAAGGPVNALSPYLVGEQGPELFVPRMSGSIVPNSALGSVGSSEPAISIVNNHTWNGNAPSRAELMAVSETTRRQTLSDVQDLIRRGGSLSRTVRGR